MKAIPASGSGRLLPLMFELGRHMKAELHKEGFEVPSWLHLETLRFIADAREAAMSDVAAYLKVAAPTATALVNGLVKDGFIVRSGDSKDRRRVLLLVSAKGKRCIADAAKKRMRAFSRVVAPLSESDRAEFARILSLITSAR